MMKMKKIFSFLLALVLLVSMVPNISLAKEDEKVVDEVIAEKTYEAKTVKAATLYWPVPGHTSLSQGFHNGNAIDISDGSIAGADVIAAIGGTVTHIYLCGTQHLGSTGDCNGFGTGLVIKGTDGRIYQYAHMQANSIPSNVYYGATVSAGQKIGRVGTTGNSSGNHLHFGISLGNYWNASGINPQYETYIYSNPTVTMSWQNDDCQPDKSNVYVYTKAVANVSGTFTQAGVTIWDSVGNVVGSKTENISTPSSYLEIWYNATNELGITLNAGTKYTYQIFTVFNGTKYSAPVKSFTTPANATSSLATPSLTSATSETDCVNIKWSSVSGATGYRLFRKTADSAWQALATQTATSYNDTDVTDGTTYYYTVRAYKDTLAMAEANAYSTTYWSGYNDPGISVTYNEKETVKPVIDLDSLKIQQLTNNKMKVSVKATDNEAIEKVTLTLRKMELGDKEASFSRDTMWGTEMSYNNGVYEAVYDGSMGRLGVECPAEMTLRVTDAAGNVAYYKRPENIVTTHGWHGDHYIVTDAKTEVALEVGENYELPKTATTVSWFMTDPDVVSVSTDGRVTALKDGECIVLGINTIPNQGWFVATSHKIIVRKEASSFVDIKETDYYYDAVLWAVENGITNGKDATHFAPTTACNRAQVVTFLWRSQGCPEPQITNNPFVDVKTSDYYYKAVLWAYENGITTGKDATHFQPTVTVTRNQFVTFLWRTEGKPTPTIKNPFVDVPDGQYYTDAVLWAYENGITTGKDATHFEPTKDCQRCQVVTFLYRAYK